MGIKRSISDHISILLVNGIVDWGPRPFKFFNAWLNNKECLSLITKEWNDTDRFKGSMSGKLRKLKRALRKWNGNARNEMENMVNEIEEKIKVLYDESDNQVLTEMEMDEMKRLNLDL